LRGRGRTKGQSGSKKKWLPMNHIYKRWGSDLILPNKRVMIEVYHFEQRKGNDRKKKGEK